MGFVASQEREGAMRVEELMSEAECCHEGDTVRDAARVMKRENVGFLPVCDPTEKPIGALTDRDIAIRVVAEGRSFDDRVATVMTRDVVACGPRDDVKAAEQLMREHQTSRVMVLADDGTLLGVVSLQDIAHGESEYEVGETLQQVKSDQPFH
jgi:CBS domain-containing protein